jgi:replicative DNA helicase
LATVGELVQETDFYDSHHQGVFSAMCRLENAGGAIDHIVVAEELKRSRTPWSRSAGGRRSLN